jgi:type II secretory pathway pseudopilin PulG
MRRRRGFSLIIVIIVLGILSVLMTFVTVQTVMQRQSLLQRERRLQARWLLRSGFDRALAKLQTSNQAFAVEWKDLVAKSSIKATAKLETKDRIELHVEAFLGVDHPQPVRLAQTWNLKRSESAGRVRFDLEEPMSEEKKSK